MEWRMHAMKSNCALWAIGAGHCFMKSKVTKAFSPVCFFCPASTTLLGIDCELGSGVWSVEFGFEKSNGQWHKLYEAHRSSVTLVIFQCDFCPSKIKSLQMRNGSGNLANFLCRFNLLAQKTVFWVAIILGLKIGSICCSYKFSDAFLCNQFSDPVDKVNP